MQRPCSCRRLRYTKWRLRKCLLDEGEKLWMKWKADAVKATARKFRPHGPNRNARTKRVYWQRFVGRCHKDRSFERPVKFRVGHGGTLPNGSMAPDNTTQYLMNIAFRDLLSDCGDCKPVTSRNRYTTACVNGTLWHLCCLQLSEICITAHTGH
ncbi:hypothetical protein AAFF_G00161980 [Aldrovandia affinis]|uniref:Uncharacterized protein n=1 Tax=Aldrovandia affinis TaxID=143900 RepID=A0AAD7RQ84_9TELE|nr:hypothetical protein AAFF_G00161980 [Aldrovandia affinis]